MRDNTTQLFFLLHHPQKKRGVVVLAKKKMNKRKPSPRAQKQTSCKKKKLQTKKAKGGKAAASSGEQEEDETKGTSAVYVAVQPTLFFQLSEKCALISNDFCLIVVRFQRALDLRYRLALDASLRVLEHFSRFRSVRPSVRRGTDGRTNARTHGTKEREARSSRSRRFFLIFFSKIH